MTEMSYTEKKTLGQEITTLASDVAVTTCVECNKPFGKDAWPGRPRITCSEACRKKRRNRQIADWRSKTPCPDNLHGTLTGYCNYSCDCDLCRAANTQYARDRRANK